jgi:hypothetical protein
MSALADDPGTGAIDVDADATFGVTVGGDGGTGAAAKFGTASMIDSGTVIGATATGGGVGSRCDCADRTGSGADVGTGDGINVKAPAASPPATTKVAMPTTAGVRHSTGSQ